MLAELLRATATRAPGTAAFVDGARRLTYAEWDLLSDRAASTLWKDGLRPGDVVALLLQPSIAYPIAYLGAAKIGCITAGINPRLAEPEIDALIAHSCARALITDDPARADVGTYTPEELLRANDAPPAVAVAVAPTDPVAIVFTSGTTGTPKGALFTARALDAVRRMESDDRSNPARGIQAIPMAHMGFMTKIAAFIARASTAVLIERWNAREALQLVAQERLTHLGGVPTQFALMLREPSFGDTDVTSLQQIVIGGAPASPELVREIRARFGVPVAQRYSCTELATCTGTRPGDPDDVVAMTVGRPHTDVDVRIDKPNADGVGEICARSAAMFSGYQRASEPSVDAHGYFHTGDLGRINADGNLVIVGRAKEMYIRGGYNVYPLEVENVLQSHPDIARAAVIGVPDDVLGERGRAYVQPRDPARAPDANALKSFVAEHIARFKVPDEIVVLAELPLTAMFKVDKRALTSSP